MKTIIYILIFFISHSISAQSSWKKIESNTKLKLNSISFGTPQVGYIGADDTTLLKTIDGGITWNLMPLTGINLHMIQDIVHVDFLNANEGYIVINNSENLVSHNSATLFTSDGGITWSFKNMGMCGAIKNYYFDTRLFILL